MGHMNRGFHPVDAVAGAGMMAWLVGMTIVLGIEEPATRAAGGLLWAGGVLLVTAAGAKAYRTAVASTD